MDERMPGAVVVGTGFGVLTHARALRGAGFEVRALVGRNREKAQARARLLGVEHAVTDLDEALALPGVDAVTIATPPHTHAQIAIAAAKAGKHLLCEKPFARDVAEARTMLHAVEAAGVAGLLGTEWRFGTGQALLQRSVRDGVVGTPRFALFVLQIPTLVDPAAELPAWWEDAREGGGWLGAYGSHVVDQIRSTLGEIGAVTGSVHTLAPRPAMTSDDTYSVEMRLDGGCVVTMHSSSAIAGPFVATTKITGTRGTAWMQGEEVWVDDGSGPRQLAPPADLPVVAPDPPPAELLRTAYDMWHSMGIDLAPYTRVCAALRRRVLAGTGATAAVDDDPAPATFADGVANQAVLDAIREASRTGAWCPVAG